MMRALAWPTRMFSVAVVVGAVFVLVLAGRAIAAGEFQVSLLIEHDAYGHRLSNVIRPEITDRALADALQLAQSTAQTASQTASQAVTGNADTALDTADSKAPADASSVAAGSSRPTATWLSLVGEVLRIDAVNDPRILRVPRTTAAPSANRMTSTQSAKERFVSLPQESGLFLLRGPLAATQLRLWLPVVDVGESVLPDELWTFDF